MFILLLIICLVVILGISFKVIIAAGVGRFQTIPDSDSANSNHSERKYWWQKKRRKYNIGLIISGLTAFILYAILGEILIAPYDEQFEITLFTIFFQGMGYIFMMLIANLFYNLGALVDKHYNKENSLTFRTRLFNLGFWFSVGLPFSIPALIVVIYILSFNK